MRWTIFLLVFGSWNNAARNIAFFKKKCSFVYLFERAMEKEEEERRFFHRLMYFPRGAVLG